MNPQGDATLEFLSKLNYPNRWVILKSVQIFKCHQRIDPNTKKPIIVDPPKLYRIAERALRLERESGVPIRMTIGHTEPGKPETAQPPVSGYNRNAHVAPFGPTGELAVVADEWLDPQYLPIRKNYPYRLSEYYDDNEQITGVGVLTRDPWLDLGVVAYDRGIPGMTADPSPQYPATHYRSDGYPATYFLVLGDPEMWPPFRRSIRCIVWR